MAKVERTQHTGYTWTHIEDPDERAMENLRKRHKFHHLDMEDCLSEIQRPKIDEYENYLFIVLHLPVETGRDGRVAQSEVNVFIGQDYLITINKGNKYLREIFENCKKRKKRKEEFMAKGNGYLLYKIVDELHSSCFPLLDHLSKTINEMEKGAFDIQNQKDMLADILVTKKNLINFRRIITPQRTLIAQLEHKNKKFLPENLEVYFDDVVDKIEKIWSNLENLTELAESLQDTNESLISHNINNVMKVLTIFSVIMLPLTFLTGLYGMNLETLPFASSNLSFLIVTGMMVGVAVIMLAFFKYKKWL
ncbi:magnesium/cobalt transporter CorA [Patescibacteria group bacterium]|nr:magnesium/cobalt transporter CorA [Patescibacteria group bacterium]